MNKRLVTPKRIILTTVEVQPEWEPVLLEIHSAGLGLRKEQARVKYDSSLLSHIQAAGLMYSSKVFSAGSATGSEKYSAYVLTHIGRQAVHDIKNNSLTPAWQ